jgi:hypothetical protein
MRDIEILTEQQRRHLVHIYASLRDCIAEEVEYNREPDFSPLDAETEVVVWQIIYTQITHLMMAAHAEEATSVQRVIDDDYGAHVARIQALEAE